ncbi:MAG: hypothetical protein BLITH_1501 [Brockia lithotrophica]|uniref:Uncharacterized protein n=1 Tax=Brockia lithotrophica TaxID=933949 RepID=A0A2T5G5G3_9BACL|nr:hypothetical protein [Brockia lithotrophica]PTQ51424.1 MAG: hypothetical protein BLITH_1501 [Brockia lithotrophica]
MPLRREHVEPFVGKPVVVDTDDDTRYIGIVEKVTDDTLYLIPMREPIRLGRNFRIPNPVSPSAASPWPTPQTPDPAFAVVPTSLGFPPGQAPAPSPGGTPPNVHMASIALPLYALLAISLLWI